MRLVARALGWTAAGLAALLAAALLLAWALSQGFQRERLRAALEGALADALGAPVRIERLGGRLYDEIRLTGVSLGDGALAAARVEIGFDPLRSARERRLLVREIVVEGLEASVRRTAEGVEIAGVPQRADTPEPEPEPGGGLAIEVERFELRRARIRYEDETTAAPTQLRVGVSGATRRLSIPADGPVSLPEAAIATVELAEPGRWDGRALDAARLHATLEGATLAVRDVRLAGAFGALDGGFDVVLTSRALPPALGAVRGRLAIEALDLAALLADERFATRLGGALEMDRDAAGRIAARLALDDAAVGG
ncbi:MAG: hypothetical protein DCC71_22630, partial [Proteobacteria bacterium]